MKPHEDIDALEARVLRAWRDADEPDLGRSWKAGVMDAVRAEAGRGNERENLPLERLVRYGFCAAAAVAVLAVGISFAARTTAFDPSLELARLLANDPHGVLQFMLVF